MPQFDPSSFASQIFWLVAMFVTLYAVVSLYAMPRLGGALEQRHRTISGDLERAYALKSEAEAMHQAYVTASTAAHAEAHGLIAETRNAALAVADEKSRVARAKLAEQTKAAEARIAVARDAAVAQIGGTASEVALLAVHHLAGVVIDQTTADAMVAQVIKGATP